MESKNKTVVDVIFNQINDDLKKIKTNTINAFIKPVRPAPSPAPSPAPKQHPAPRGFLSLKSGG